MRKRKLLLRQLLSLIAQCVFNEFGFVFDVNIGAKSRGQRGKCTSWNLFPPSLDHLCIPWQLDLILNKIIAKMLH